MTQPHQLKPLVGDPVREAVDALSGFDHQVWRTVLEWLRLPPDHALYVEGAEDLDRHTPDSIEAVQIKNTTGTVTLRTVLDSIVDFWLLRRDNRSDEVHFSYLTTAQRGVERDRPFGDVPGLDQWDRSREGADLAGLPAFLSREMRARLQPAGPKKESKKNRLRREARNEIIQDLVGFLERASDDEVRVQLIQRVTWDTVSATQDEIRVRAERALIAYGESLPDKLSPHESVQVLDHLVQHVWSVAKQPHGQRWLHRADWQTIFQERTMLLVPRAVYRQVVSAGSATASNGVPDEQHLARRRHDLDVLREFSFNVHWPSLREFIENAPQRYRSDVLGFQAALEEFVAADFFLYDTELGEQIRAMSERWENVLAIAGNYVERTKSGAFVWPLIGDLEPLDRVQAHAWKQASVSVAALRDSRDQVLARLRERYPEVNLKEGSDHLWRRMKAIEGVFNTD